MCTRLTSNHALQSFLENDLRPIMREIHLSGKRPCVHTVSDCCIAPIFWDGDVPYCTECRELCSLMRKEPEIDW